MSIGQNSALSDSEDTRQRGMESVARHISSSPTEGDVDSRLLKNRNWKKLDSTLCQQVNSAEMKL